MVSIVLQYLVALNMFLGVRGVPGFRGEVWRPEVSDATQLS